jgi:hypothetical protein
METASSPRAVSFVFALRDVFFYRDFVAAPRLVVDLLDALDWATVGDSCSAGLDA